MKIRNEMNVLLKVFFVIIVCVSAQTVLFIDDNQKAAQAAVDESESALNASGFDIIILDQEGYKKDRKGPVIFYHQKHAN